MSESPSQQDECIRRAAEQMFSEARKWSELTRGRVLELAGGTVGMAAFERVFPGRQFTAMRHTWILQRIKAAMDTVFATAQVQRDVTLRKVAALAGCSSVAAAESVGPEFRARRAALPDSLADSRERVLQAIQRLVAAKIPPREFQWARVYAEAGEKPMKPDAEANRAFRDGLETLIRYHDELRQQRISGATYACLQGVWVNVDGERWFLPSTRRTLRRDLLRPDIADVAWPQLREEALTTAPSAQTLSMHYQGCISLAQLFGDIIPDIRAITLSAIQQAWFRFEGSKRVLINLRVMLVRLLEALITQGGMDATLTIQEYARVASWVQMINLRKENSDKVYLSEAEFDTLLDGCLEDIKQGLAYTQRSGSPVGQETTDIHAEDAVVVLYWGIALIVLVMAFTGLRRQSIVRLTVDDIAQIGPQAFALAWRHGKPGKERIAIIPALVAEHLSHYIRTTAPVRERLGTQQIFFARNASMRWDHMTAQRVTWAFASFSYRHALLHNGTPFRVGSTLLRRTYVTRALYELPSIAVLQAQLGHDNPSTTLGYAQHDRFEHPAQVDAALDTFGRKVLIRWHAPLLLNDLPDAERQALLGARVAHEQDVGLCRYDCCVQLVESHLPPCSLCEHLVSGPEYLAAWEREKTFRERQLERLAVTPGAQLLQVQMKGQYDRFLANYLSVQERSRA